MQFRIEYVDGQAQELEGEYVAYENYIEFRIPTIRGESYRYYDLIIPMHRIMSFEAHD